MSILESVGASLYHALLVGLTPSEYNEYVYEDNKEKGPRQPIQVKRATGKILYTRPREDHCDIVVFPQTWGSTALGFGGIGGKAMTTAYTVVVTGPRGDACIYFGGTFAYHVDKPNHAFREALNNRNVVARGKQSIYERVSAPPSPSQPDS